MPMRYLSSKLLAALMMVSNAIFSIMTPYEKLFFWLHFIKIRWNCARKIVAREIQPLQLLQFSKHSWYCSIQQIPTKIKRINNKEL
ncbi:uncharacterized protein DS421_17g593960 [Arachis hypogaea]|nr:uncharacterized protein DS421_17g593960 [Arachis hypogaea]